MDWREPTTSVDAKKRELLGDFKAVGREWEPSGRPGRGPLPGLPIERDTAAEPPLAWMRPCSDEEK